MQPEKTVKRKCRVCKEEFVKQRPLQAVCSPRCAVADAQARAAKKRVEQERQAKREARAKAQAAKNRLKRLSDWAAEAQAAANRYVRLRDHGQPCISCGRPWAENFQAGHYIPRGRGSALRFDADNIHAQCPQCNLYESGNLIQYRRGLIAKIGAARVEEMETAGYAAKKWTVAELQEIKAYYRAKAKELES